MDTRTEYAYQAFYCEENIWQFLKTRAVQRPSNDAAVFITNEDQHVALAQQQQGDEQGIVIWDYHVIAITYDPSPLIWDFDSRLPFPCSATDWLQQTFAAFKGAPKIYHPIFKVCKAHLFLGEFQSDRRHMRDELNRWLKPPPEWPNIGRGHNLDDWLDLSCDKLGSLYDYDELMNQFVCATN